MEPRPVNHPFFSRFYQSGQGLVETVIGEFRHEQNSRAQGRTLILGAGTGLDVPALGPETTDVVLLEPDRSMRGYLSKKYPELPVLPSPGESIPSLTGVFDTVISTLVLCSVRDLAQVLREVARVLKPSGQYLFLEHVRNEQVLGQTVQRLLDPGWQRIGGGCHLTRDVCRAVRVSPLVLNECDVLRSGWVFPLIRGRATPRP
ncbi:MAG: class I SAM-dependent methyltransferase [Thermaerobacter sp.]|nr:class I SAM-dependent methyltransferase [Thermaerobacter sp.]